jgi:hypothetical protein
MSSHARRGLPRGATIQIAVPHVRREHYGLLWSRARSRVQFVPKQCCSLFRSVVCVVLVDYAQSAWRCRNYVESQVVGSWRNAARRGARSCRLILQTSIYACRQAIVRSKLSSWERECKVRNATCGQRNYKPEIQQIMMQKWSVHHNWKSFMQALPRHALTQLFDAWRFADDPSYQMLIEACQPLYCVPSFPQHSSFGRAAQILFSSTTTNVEVREPDLA